MKKLIVVIIMLAAGGALFFAGWAQSGVPPGSWGVLRSKTHGVDPQAIREGEIRWVWYKLIPRNTETAVFRLDETLLPIDISGVLPSGDVYSAMAGLKTDFSYALSLGLRFRLKGESLPALAEKENLLGQDDLDRYMKKLAGEIEGHARGLFWAYAGNETALKEAHETGTIRALEEQLRAAFPQTENIACTVKTLRFPDFILYEEVRRLYGDYLAAQRSDIKEKTLVMAVENAQRRRRFDELSAYGELLTKYPVLIKYLALEKGIPSE